ncbi:MAG: bifunctional glycosyltransferase family 2/GtrA family protein [Micropruina sp.]|nr:bifunctional glycosyltransferase family 2/GtrA family protein [Micropruina sp.]
MIVLIPAYEPTRSLLDLLRDLAREAPEIGVVVVDDGSGPLYAPLFSDAVRLGADVIGYAGNRGKGAALKHGFAHLARHYPGQDVVCADSDGQHAVVDVLRVGRAVRPGCMVLGVRAFSGRVPARSRIGNAITRWAFRAASGVSVSDTQTGLRGYPAAALPWLGTVSGDRFEYELNLLLQARRAGWTFDEVPIATIYLAGNASSHFRPLVDSARIYLPLLAFSASSLAAFAIDFVALLVLNALTDNLLLAVIGARGLSSAVNFITNRRMVFDSRRPLRGTLVRYYLLVAVLLVANYGLLAWLTSVGLALAVAKVIVEVTLFVAGYQVQRSFVFGLDPAPIAAVTPARERVSIG